MLTLAGTPAADAAEHAKKVLALETSLAEPARTRVELRDPQKNYNKMKQAELQALTARLEVGRLLQGDQSDRARATSMSASRISSRRRTRCFTNTSIDDWKIYLRWHLIHAAAAELSSDFVNENFRFFGNDPDRRETIEAALETGRRLRRIRRSGEALGKLYVADNFPPESKARMIELVKNVQEAMADSIKSRDWMDDATKQEALKKLAAFTVKIGYPDKWRDYSALKIDRGPVCLECGARGNVRSRARS